MAENIYFKPAMTDFWPLGGSRYNRKQIKNKSKITEQNVKVVKESQNNELKEAKMLSKYQETQELGNTSLWIHHYIQLPVHTRGHLINR